MVKTIGIFCASSSGIDKKYFDASEKLGKIVAENGLICYTGAGNSGLMDAVENGVLQNGGQCIGVIPKFMVEMNWRHLGLSETIITDTMAERKQILREKSDAAVFLAGGIGTLDEFFEILTLKQLGLFCKPIIILNTDNYYNELLKFLDKIIEGNFMRIEHRQMWQVVHSPEEVLPAFAASPNWHCQNIELALIEK